MQLEDAIECVVVRAGEGEIPDVDSSSEEVKRALWQGIVLPAFVCEPDWSQQILDCLKS